VIIPQNKVAPSNLPNFESKEISSRYTDMPNMIGISLLMTDL
jgi:hypothetical protein